MVLALPTALAGAFFLVEILANLDPFRWPGWGTIAGCVGCWTWTLGVCLVARKYLRQMRSDRRFEPFFCEQCGYDLRGSTGICSECGRPIPPSRAIVAQRLREMFPEE
jgi:hypothetical protein